MYKIGYVQQYLHCKLPSSEGGRKRILIFMPLFIFKPSRPASLGMNSSSIPTFHL